MKVLFLGPEEKNSNYSSRTFGNGAEIVHIPAVKLTPVKETLDRLSKVRLKIEYMIFTSAFAAGLVRNMPVMHNVSLFIAIGGKTAKSLNDAGMHNVVTPYKESSDGIISLIAQLKRGRAVLISSENGRDFTGQMREMGFDAMMFTVYRAEADKDRAKIMMIKDIIQNGKVDYVLVTSSMIARTIATEIGIEKASKKIKWIAIGLPTASEMVKCGMHVDTVSDIPDIERIIESL